MTNDDKCVMCCGDVGTSATNFFMEVSRINQDAYVEQYLQTGTGNRKVKSGSIVIRRLSQKKVEKERILLSETNMVLNILRNR